MSDITFSPSTIHLFANLLGQVQIPAGADNFEAQAAVVTVARRELAAALATLPQDTPAEGDDLGVDVTVDTAPPPNRAARRARNKR